MSASAGVVQPHQATALRPWPSYPLDQPADASNARKTSVSRVQLCSTRRVKLLSRGDSAIGASQRSYARTAATRASSMYRKRGSSARGCGGVELAGKTLGSWRRKGSDAAISDVVWMLLSRWCVGHARLTGGFSCDAGVPTYVVELLLPFEDGGAIAGLEGETVAGQWCFKVGAATESQAVSTSVNARTGHAKL